MPEKNTLPAKERMKIKRIHMPEQAPETRAHNFQEVNQGLSAEQAQLEATRCIGCAKPGCVVDCPVGVKIREVVDLIYAGEYRAAARKMREDNALPAVTGRVGPQEISARADAFWARRASRSPSATLSASSPTTSAPAVSLVCRRSIRRRARASPSSAAVRPHSRPPET